jgi:hypothetical protein
VAVDQNGHVVAIDEIASHPRLIIFSSDGARVEEVAHPKILFDPRGVAIHHDGRIFVADGVSFVASKVLGPRELIHVYQLQVSSSPATT